MGRIKNDIKQKPKGCSLGCWQCEECKWCDHKNNICILAYVGNCEIYEVYNFIRNKIKPKEILK